MITIQRNTLVISQQNLKVKHGQNRPHQGKGVKRCPKLNTNPVEISSKPKPQASQWPNPVKKRGQSEKENETKASAILREASWKMR